MNASDKSANIPENVIVPVSISATEATSIFNKDANVFKRQQLTENEIKHMTHVLNTKLPTTTSNSIELFLPNIVYTLKSSIVNRLSRKCKHLCKVKNGSVLYGHDYDSLAEFRFSNIWTEMVNNHPFFVDFLSGMSGISTDFATVPENIQTKFCFIYSILMNIRCSKVSLMQRMNATMMIEGGGSRNVS